MLLIVSFKRVVCGYGLMEKLKSIVVDFDDQLLGISSQVSGKSIWILHGDEIQLNPKECLLLNRDFLPASQEKGIERIGELIPFR